METLFLHYIESYEWLAYILIFIALLIEGEAVLFISAYLVHQGYLKIEMLLPVVAVAVLTGDVLWYKFGTYIEESVPFIKKRLTKLTGPVDKLILTKTFHTIILAKFAYGMNRATLVRFGALKVPFRNFFRFDLVAMVLWVTVIFSVGYASSASFTIIKHYLKYAEVGIFLGLIILFLFTHFITRFGLKERSE